MYSIRQQRTRRGKTRQKCSSQIALRLCCWASSRRTEPTFETVCLSVCVCVCGWEGERERETLGPNFLFLRDCIRAEILNPTTTKIARVHWRRLRERERERESILDFDLDRSMVSGLGGDSIKIFFLKKQHTDWAELSWGNRERV